MKVTKILYFYNFQKNNLLIQILVGEKKNMPQSGTVKCNTVLRVAPYIKNLILDDFEGLYHTTRASTGMSRHPKATNSQIYNICCMTFCLSWKLQEVIDTIPEHLRHGILSK